MSSIGLFLNGTAGAADGVAITSLAPGTVPNIATTGAEVVSPAVRVTVRTLTAGARRLGAFTIDLYGTNADCWQLAADSGSSPGSWGSWGAALALPGPITDVNTAFWMRARAKDGEVASGTTDDLSVVFRTPDDVIVPVGKSWALPFSILSSSAVGRSWLLPYSVKNAVGASWALPSNVLAAVGKSWALPYAVKSVANARWLLWEFDDSYGASSDLIRLWDVEVNSPDILTTGMAYSASSVYSSPTYDPVKVADAEPSSNTSWATGPDGTPGRNQWLKVDLGSSMTISQFRLAAWSSVASPKTFRLYGSTVASPGTKTYGASHADWTQLLSGTLPDGAGGYIAWQYL